MIKTQHPAHKAADRRAAIALAVTEYLRTPLSVVADNTFVSILLTNGVLQGEDFVFDIFSGEHSDVPGSVEIQLEHDAVFIDADGNVTRGAY
jgi:hypothetical protein